MDAKRIVIPDSPDFIQLLWYATPDAPKHFQNLSRCSASGAIIWIAELPTSPGSCDAYVDVELADRRLVARSWSCYKLELNIDSGKIEKLEFTK